ncbi:hypothetical protein Hanom_Chr11g00988281 [Helianthus anomalus]
MFVHLTNQTKFRVHVRSFIKRTNINELPAERFTNCSLNLRFVYNPNKEMCAQTLSNIHKPGSYQCCSSQMAHTPRTDHRYHFVWSDKCPIPVCYQSIISALYDHLAITPAG